MRKQSTGDALTWGYSKENGEWEEVPSQRLSILPRPSNCTHTPTERGYLGQESPSQLRGPPAAFNPTGEGAFFQNLGRGIHVSPRGRPTWSLHLFDAIK